jgi:hypothetical protein
VALAQLEAMTGAVMAHATLSLQLADGIVVGHMLEATFDIGYWSAVCGEPGGKQEYQARETASHTSVDVADTLAIWAYK